MEYKLEWLVILYSSSLDGLKRLGTTVFLFTLGILAYLHEHHLQSKHVVTRTFPKGSMYCGFTKQH